MEPRAGFEPATLRGKQDCLSAYEADALWCRETSTRLSHRGTKPSQETLRLKAPTITVFAHP